MKKPKKPQEKLKEKVTVSTAQLTEEIIKAEGILNSIGDGISILDRTFKILYENQIHKDMLGDNAGKYCYRAYRQREGICSGCPVALIFKDGEIHKVQRKIKTDEGTTYFEITASPLRDSEGNIIAGIEVIRDITERKQIETELQLSEEKYRMTVDFLNDALHVTDENLNIVLVNKKLLEWHKVFGLETDVVGKNVFEVYPFLLSKVQEEYKDVIKTGNSLRTEESTLIDGEVVISETIKIPILENNKVTKIITIMRDITELKKFQNELQKSETAIKTLIDAHSSPALLLEPDGTVIWCNDAVSRILGIPRNKLIGTNDFEKMPTEVAARRRAVLKQVLQTGKTVRFDDDTTPGIVYDTIVAPIVNKDGKVYRAAILAHDITVRKKMEEELKKRVKELEDFYDMAVGRELRMKELKEEIKELKKKLEKYVRQ